MGLRNPGLCSREGGHRALFDIVYGPLRDYMNLLGSMFHLAEDS